MIKTGVWLGLALTGVLVMGCGSTSSDGSPTASTTAASTADAPSPTEAVQQVSDKTICDLLFRDNGVIVKSAALMRKRQTTADTARRAREYAAEADKIGTHADVDMATKVDALGSALRDSAEKAAPPTAGVHEDALAIAKLELANSCGSDLPKTQGRPNDAAPADAGPNDAGPAQNNTKHLTYFEVTVTHTSTERDSGPRT